MTFDRLVNMYLIESEQLDPPYIKTSKFGTYYYKDPKHKILHRDEKDPVTGLSLPAIEYPSGSKQWYVDGKRHRLDGPAYEYVDGSKEWFVDGKLHRLDGPAIEYADGTKEWWVDGKELTKEEFDEYHAQLDAQLDATDKVSKAGNLLSSELIKSLFK